MAVVSACTVFGFSRIKSCFAYKLPEGSAAPYRLREPSTLSVSIVSTTLPPRTSIVIAGSTFASASRCPACPKPSDATTFPRASITAETPVLAERTSQTPVSAAQSFVMARK